MLSPFLAPEVALPPLFDRAVLFLSDRVLHRTERAAVQRLAVTTWYDGDAVNAPHDVGLRLPPSAMQVRSSAVLCHLKRCLHTHHA